MMREMPRPFLPILKTPIRLLWTGSCVRRGEKQSRATSRSIFGGGHRRLGGLGLGEDLAGVWTQVLKRSAATSIRWRPARRLIDQVGVPAVDAIDGLPPAVTPSAAAGRVQPRSSVGSVTTLPNPLRMLYSRAGTHPSDQPMLFAEDFSQHAAGRLFLLPRPGARVRGDRRRWCPDDR